MVTCQDNGDLSLPNYMSSQVVSSWGTVTGEGPTQTPQVFLSTETDWDASHCCLGAVSLTQTYFYSQSKQKSPRCLKYRIKIKRDSSSKIAIILDYMAV